jgi:hypothetical protein
MNENNIFIKLLRLGESKGIQGIDENEFKKWALSHQEIDNEYCEEFHKIRRLFLECFDEIIKSHGIPNEYILKTEYYFRLIEFQELELSRETAASANKHSKIAIGISLVAIFIGIVATIIQSQSQVTIDSSQISHVSNKLDTIILKQDEQLKDLNKINAK